MPIKYTLSVKLLVVAFNFLTFPQAAFADDTLYTIVCDCDPGINDDAMNEISTQVTPHSGEFGSLSGFENGDEVIIKNASGSIAR